ncbi:MAG TPA: uracil-DNA glycosylase [Casimicrobiaceae bacterium]|nr:uracil-DNA glycosylase [Casimicrobiaceae bacterium]
MTARVEILRELGLLPLWRLRRGPENAAADEAAPGALKASEPPAALERGDALVDDRGRRIAMLDWRSFAADVDACTACGLCRTRNRSVPGVGDESAQWLFIGEAPGAEEDAKGEPFVGQAGRLLDSMLAALGMRRGENVYIANVLKCRPPGNRTPEPREAEACRPYLDRQIALIGPRIIVALGKSAATTLLNVEASIASLRGRVHRYQGVPLIVTYHPAYLLRNLPDKAKAWEDLCLARATMRRLSDGGEETSRLQSAGTGPN